MSSCRLKKIGGELGSKDIAISGIAVGEARLDSGFALAAQVAVGGVKIIEARR